MFPAFVCRIRSLFRGIGDVCHAAAQHAQVPPLRAQLPYILSRADAVDSGALCENGSPNTKQRPRAEHRGLRSRRNEAGSITKSHHPNAQ